MKTIDTLVKDINDWLEETTHTFNEENLNSFLSLMKEVLVNRFNDYVWTPKITLSNLGTPCRRKLWYTVNMKEKGERLSPSAVLKFLYGDILELLILLFAKEAGHKVEGEQDHVEIQGIKGRRDAIIDGVVVDVKTTNDRGMAKFRKGLTSGDDSFGYLTQLDTYLEASQSDDLVTEKNTSAFLVVDKTLGHLVLDKHTRKGVNYKEMVEETREMISRTTPPDRGYKPIPEGKSGNMKLGTTCKYCAFKHECWPGLRTFIYSNGLMFLTTVAKTPRVQEVP